MKISSLQVLADGIESGAIASVATAAAIAVAGKIENNRPVEAINAISHVVWDDEAFDAKKLDFKHTLLGLTINDSAMISWGILFEILRSVTNSRGDIGRTLACSGVMGIVAYFIDYKIVPPRFTPGIEKHLSGRALFAIYAVFVLALAISALRRREKKIDPA